MTEFCSQRLQDSVLSQTPRQATLTRARWSQWPVFVLGSVFASSGDLFPHLFPAFRNLQNGTIATKNRATG